MYPESWCRNTIGFEVDSYIRECNSRFHETSRVFPSNYCFDYPLLKLNLAALMASQLVKGRALSVSGVSSTWRILLDDLSVLFLSQHSLKSFVSLSKVWCPDNTVQYINNHIIASFYLLTIIAKTSLKLPFVAFLTTLLYSASTIQCVLYCS